MARSVEAFGMTACLIAVQWSLAFLADVVWAAPTPVATVVTARGAVVVQRKGAKAFLPLKERSSLFAGDVVGAQARSGATVLFSDGSQARLKADSAIEITPPTSVGKGRQSLFRALANEVWARVRPNKAVQTPSAIAGARGTEFHLRVDPDGTTTLTVLEGEVDFFNELGAVAVGASQQSVARRGVAPTAPVTVSNAGFTIEWTLELDRVAIPREKFFLSPDRAQAEREVRQRAESVRQNTDDPAAHLNLGDALFDTHRFEEALKEYEESDRLSPRQAPTRTRIGSALLELDRLDEAEQSFESALEVDAQHAPALVGLAILQLSRGRPREALQAAEQAVAADAQSAEAHVAFGLALMRQPGRLAEAAVAFRAALTGEPSSYRYQAHAWLAMVYSAQDDHETALREAKTAVELGPRSALAHGNLALVCFFNGKTNEARREARLAVRLNPDSVAARCALAQAFLAQGDVDAAAATAAKAVALDSDLPQAQYLLGIADAQRRDLTRAARELKACLRLAPDFLPAVGALARVYTSMGRSHYDDAIKLLSDLLPRHRNTDQVLAALGSIYYQQGRYKDAGMQYREALKKRPNSALYHSELARVLLDYNRLSEAIRSGQKAVQLAPGVSQYHSTLGLCYDFSGLISRAEREYREALTLDPQNALARARLALLGAVDARTFLNSITQSFLFDPALPTQLMRGGINSELAPSAGNEPQQSLRLTNRTTSERGAFHSFGFYNHQENEGDNDRANDGASSSAFSEYMTYLPDARTNLFANVSHVVAGRGLPGPSHFLGFPFEDADDRESTHLGQFQVAERRRIQGQDYLWCGMTYQSLRGKADHLNPALPPDPALVEGVDSVARDVALEVRADFALPSQAPRSPILTLGAARVVEDLSEQLDRVFWLRTTNLKSRYYLGYLQLSQQPSERLSFIAQLRGQREDTTTQVGSTWQRDDLSLLLPSLVASYRADARTALRLFANRQSPQQVTVTFAPTESLLTTESSVFPDGDPRGTVETFELDVERYLSPGELVKLFLFRTRAKDLTLGAEAPGFFAPFLPLTLSETRRVGVGVRYEKPLWRNLFGNVQFVINDTENNTPGAAFDDGTAPYQPKTSARLGLDYVDAAGTKLRLRLRHVGSFYQDSSTLNNPRPRFPAHTYVDLFLSKEPSVHTEFFVNLYNVFDRPMIEFNDYPTGRRRMEVGVTKRF
ncbi:MAG: TonB-dependent receptor [Armatimonadetes bacterium]|nr:TonB-dependent receptor [Armatimonadota bacterium]